MKGADKKYVYPARKVLRKREFGGFSPFLCCPGKWSGQNGISHPHWVKICDDHNGQFNLRDKQKYEVLSATQSTYLSLLSIFHISFELFLVTCLNFFQQPKQMCSSRLTFSQMAKNGQIFNRLYTPTLG